MASDAGDCEHGAGKAPGRGARVKEECACGEGMVRARIRVIVMVLEELGLGYARIKKERTCNEDARRLELSEQHERLAR